MADQATETMVIAAPAPRIWDVLVDFEAYPGWARDLKGVTVDVMGDDGLGREVTYRAAAMGRSTGYTLAYEYGDDPMTISWQLVRGDIMRRLDGSYLLEPVDGDPSRTQVTYHLDVELIVPLPGFVKRRAETKIVHTALRELRDHVEA
ncbi:MAG TPA: SRPBCC family protein [Acidimicrobiales bacterium]|nr:SRPBCC family protein [Acidimicrobiales bacterium]